MPLAAFMQAGWADHAGASAAVAARLDQGEGLITGSAQIPAFANLAVHVLGEHLGRWDDGLALLGRLAARADCDSGGESGRAVARLQAVLWLCKSDRTRSDGCAARALEGSGPAASTHIRVLTLAAAALVGQKRVGDAAALFEEALALAAYGPQRDDPAARALAVTGNNLAVELEGKDGKSAPEVALMLRAAATGRTYWEIAGGWVEVMWAEYRLAMSYLAAGKPEVALLHADLAAAACRQHNASYYERFFTHEARAKCCHACGRAADASKARADAQQALLSMRSSLDYMTKELAALDAFLT